MNKNTRRIKKLIAHTKGEIDLLIPPRDYSRVTAGENMPRHMVENIMTVRRVRGLK